jgi:hypothetical protein
VGSQELVKRVGRYRSRLAAVLQPQQVSTKGGVLLDRRGVDAGGPGRSDRARVLVSRAPTTPPMLPAP